MLQSGGNITTTSSAAAAEQSAADIAAAEAAEEAGERGFGGNRWPRQETLALLKIRSEMDVAFRDATVKGPLWEEVSRKLSEFGYQRSAKKCKEKFENVYKYHKRTKEGRTGKTDGKTYRFFDQLQALETPNTLITFSQPPPPPPSVTVPSTTVTPINNSAVNVPPLNVPPTTTTMNAMMNAISSSNYFPGNMNMNMNTNTNSMNMNMNMISGELFQSESPSSSSSTSSDEIGGGGDRGGRGRKRKRKWKEFFERLTKQVVEKQEELQRRFLETVEKREHERMVREESWRTQEMARINREREILAQERSMAAAKDAAVMAFLQKLSENNAIPTAAASVPRRPHVTSPPPRSIPVGSMDSVPPPPQPSPLQPPSVPAAMGIETPNALRTDNGDRSIMTPPLASSSRWPKVEIEALIMLRTNLDSKYQENGPKGPLWEEISAGMRRLGYNRNAKRCKEKWENINKYFKKVKESNKKRPEDSKTCPYFHQLEALYRQKSSRFVNFQDQNNTTSSSGQIKPENSVPLMVQPEQQWPPPKEGHFGQNLDDDEDDDVDEDGDKIGDEDDEEEDEEGGEFEIVPNNNNNK